MAIAFDAASGFTNNTGTDHTLAHTCTGSNRLLIAAVRNGGTTDTLTGVTYAGTAMTLIAKKLLTSNQFSYLFYLIAPATGTNNIVASFSGSEGTQLSGSSYTGVKQSGQPDASNTLEETGSGDRTISVTVVLANCWLVATHISANSQPGSVVTGVSRTTLNNCDVIDSNGTVGTGAQTIGWNWAASDSHVMVAASIAPALPSGGGFTETPFMKTVGSLSQFRGPSF